MAQLVLAGVNSHRAGGARAAEFQRHRGSCRAAPVVTRRLLVRRQIDDSWDTSGELVRHAAGYLEDLGEGGLQERDIDLIGYHPEIAKIRARIRKLADTVWPVLMVGERGTGKGHILRAIAKTTGETPLVVALAGMPEDLADPELFGHTKGAFTGAHKARDGIILTAHRSGSPIFLDDVGECSPAVQAKLLTVLDDGVFRPIGSDEVLSVGRGPERRFRIYSASQPGPLRKLRPDLRDRLATIMVHIPPLRERPSPGGRSQGGSFSDHGRKAQRRLRRPNRALQGRRPLELAALEYLVHIDAEDAPHDLVALRLHVPDGATELLYEPAALPAEWRSALPPPDCQAIGDHWARSGKHLLLRVPSVLVPEEFNVRVNPTHPDAARIRISASSSFSYDLRLFDRSGSP